MKKRRIYKACLGVFLLLTAVLSALLGYYFSNTHAFENRKKGLEETVIPLDSVSFLNWEGSDGVYLSREDPIMDLQGIETYVEELAIRAKLSEDQLSPKVYYTTSPDESYSEEKSIICEYDVENNTLYLPVQREVYSLRVDLTENAGVSMELAALIVNQTEPCLTFYTVEKALIFFAGIACSGLIILVSVQTFHRDYREYAKTFVKYRHLLHNLVARDIKVKYRRSVLGIAWSVLNPLLMMLVITAVFNNLFRFNIEYFPIYYLTGSLLFNFITDATGNAMTSVLYASALIRKVHLPKYIFPLEKCLFAFVNMLFASVATLIVMVILRFPIQWTALLFPIPMLFSFVFSVGLGLLLATSDIFFRDTGHLYGVWTTAWFYLTPIIYPIEILPAVVTRLVKLNPVYYYIVYFRDVVMYGQLPDLKLTLICILSSMLFLCLGLVVFKKRQDRFILFI